MPAGIELHENIKPTVIDDLQTPIEKLKGPVESFVPKGNKEVIEHAMQTGHIQARAFADCSMFDDTDLAREQHKLRQEAKRTAEVRKILAESELLPESAQLDMRLAGLFIGQSLARATVVEAAAQDRQGELAGTLTDDLKERYLRQVDISQEILFPLPDHETAAIAARNIMSHLASTNETQFAHVTAKYEFLKQFETPLSNELISGEKRREWYEMLHEKYDPIFAGIREEVGDASLERETLLQATRLFMEAQGIPLDGPTSNGWTTRYDKDVKGFRVDPNIREVVVGRRDEPLDQLGFEKLMMHEVVIHVTRAENGYQTGYPALQNGLPGNAEPEEGTGLVIESLWSGEPLNQVSREDYRYLVVCYSDGTMDGEKHSEEETYMFACDVMGLRPGDESSKQTGDMSLSQAGEHTLRAFRGMPPERRMYSNLAYLPGKLNMAAYINSSERPAADTLAWLQRGKSNPLDPEHEDIMEQVERIGRAA